MSSEISQLCLEALSPLAEQCAKSQDKDMPLFIATRHFLKVHHSPVRGHKKVKLEFIIFGFNCLAIELNDTGRVFLVQLVFDMLVLQKHNMEMTVAAGEAFYTLVCLHQVNKQHLKHSDLTFNLFCINLIFFFCALLFYDAHINSFIGHKHCVLVDFVLVCVAIWCSGHCR